MKGKSCLWWALAIIGWFLFWGMCISLGDNLKISPFVILITIIMFTIAILAIIALISSKIYNWKYKKYQNRVTEIKNKYNLAYNSYLNINQIKRDYSTQIVTDYSALKEISGRSDSIWEKEETELRTAEEKRRKELEIRNLKIKKDVDRIKKLYPEGLARWTETKKLIWKYGVTDSAISDSENEIKEIDIKIKEERWEREQNEFNDICDNLSKQYSSFIKKTTYIVPVLNTELRSFKVNQFYCYSTCLEDLDYTFFPHIKECASWIKDLMDSKRKFKLHIYENIANYIKEIADNICKKPKENITVLFNIDKEWKKNVLSFHYNPLYYILSNERYNINISCNYTSIFDDFEEKKLENRLLPTDDYVIIFDITTKKSELFNLCKRIFAYDKDAYPVITYISLIKVYERNEMSSLIELKKRKESKLEKERQEKENAIKNLLDSVKSWDALESGLHYTYLFYYYPVSNCDFEATDEEWNNRRIVWHFKNTPGKTSETEHQNAINQVIPKIKQKLETTFKEESLKYLTFVCIPASSQIKTQARYEDFSYRICKELGMINAYPHISVIQDKEEKHLGGSTIDTNKLYFDEVFFKDKYVLLFDDIITKGESMRTFKRKLESMGACVIAGFSLGITKHHRVEIGKSANTFPPLPELPQIFNSEQPPDIDLPF